LDIKTLCELVFEWLLMKYSGNKSEEFNSDIKARFSTDNSGLNASPVCYLNSPGIRDEFKQ